MYSFKEYLKLEILKGTNNIYLSFFKNLLRIGNLNAMMNIRLYQILVRKKNFFWKILSLYLKNRLIRIYGIEISKNVEIGIGLHIGHANGIIFGENVKIGKNAVIYHQVTFGIDKLDRKGNMNSYPTIGDNCVFYAGSKVFGKINVENGTILGSNSVLLSSTMENGVYGGVPAKKIK